MHYYSDFPEAAFGAMNGLRLGLEGKPRTWPGPNQEMCSKSPVMTC